MNTRCLNKQGEPKNGDPQLRVPYSRFMQLARNSVCRPRTKEGLRRIVMNNCRQIRSYPEMSFLGNLLPVK